MLWYLAGYQFVRDISETVVLMEHSASLGENLRMGNGHACYPQEKLKLKMEDTQQKKNNKIKTKKKI